MPGYFKHYQIQKGSSLCWSNVMLDFGDIGKKKKRRKKTTQALSIGTQDNTSTGELMNSLKFSSTVSFSVSDQTILAAEDIPLQELSIVID